MRIKLFYCLSIILFLSFIFINLSPSAKATSCISNSDCSGYSCSGCFKINNVCSNGQCVAGSGSGTPSSLCNSACSGTKICAGCMLTNTTCNSAGQCVANSAAGQVASSSCNYTCSGSWTNSSGQICGQTCNSSGTCQNNSATCSGPTPSFTPSPTASPSPAIGCHPGYGSTNASCGGNQTSPMCNGSTCQTQGYYCSAGACVLGWAGGSASSACNPPCLGPTPSPIPTPTPKPTYCKWFSFLCK